MKDNDFVYLHIEASDEAGHEGDIDLKLLTIENLDKRAVGPIYEAVKDWDEPVAIAVLPDHPTPCELRTHTSDPIPFLIWYPGIEPDEVQTYDEIAACNGSYGLLKEDEFIKDFMIISPDLGDVTDEILTNKNYQFLLLSSDIAKADDSEIDRINEIYDYALVHGYNFYCVTASSQEDIARWQDDTGAEYPFYYMDETAIKTIMRANPSMMLLKDGIIYWKRSASSLPDESVLTASLEKLSLGQIRIYNADRRIMFLALIYLVPMLILLLTEKTVAAIIVNIKNLRMKRRQEKALRSKGRKINIEKETTKNDNKEL